MDWINCLWLKLSRFPLLIYNKILNDPWSKLYFKAGKMAQKVKVLATQYDVLILITIAHVTKEKNQFSSPVLSHSQACCGIHGYPLDIHMRIHIHGNTCTHTHIHAFLHIWIHTCYGEGSLLIPQVAVVYISNIELVLALGVIMPLWFIHLISPTDITPMYVSCIRLGAPWEIA